MRERASLHRWLAEVPGQGLLAAERAYLGAVLPNLFGYHLLQVGRLGTADLLSPSRILSRIVVETDCASAESVYPVSDPKRNRFPYPTLVGDATSLPVDSDSVDVVVLPHVLEFEDNPHEALREASRVLVPKGHLLICAFNPWSAFGLWQLRPRRRRSIPWRGQFLGVNRVKDWLALLGFDLLDLHPCCFRPPFRNQSLLGKLSFMETVGPRVCPFFSGVYVALARKRVTTLTPIKPRWCSQSRLVGVSLAGPSARVRDGD